MYGSKSVVYFDVLNTIAIQTHAHTTLVCIIICSSLGVEYRDMWILLAVLLVALVGRFANELVWCMKLVCCILY